MASPSDFYYEIFIKEADSGSFIKASESIIPFLELKTMMSAKTEDGLVLKQILKHGTGSHSTFDKNYINKLTSPSFIMRIYCILFIYLILLLLFLF